MNYIQVTIPVKDSEHADILLAILATEGYDGFEEGDKELKAFIPETAFDASVLAAMKLPFHLEYSTKLIVQQNWNAQWESSFEPVIVNGFAIVRAAFHETNPAIQHDIVVTPKMSFGTGHHATTYMMMQQMESIDLAGKSVVDFGTGTGVLAILAEKMGAASILAIDNDDWSIDNARENTASNNCHAILVEKAEVIPSGSHFDVILANINLNVIRDNIKIISLACASTGTQVLLSGFLKTDEATMAGMLKANDFSVTGVMHRGEWLSIAAFKAGY